MSLPPLHQLRLTPTGEFYPLNKDQVNDLNRENAEEPITQQRFQLDADGPQDAWHTFRVQLEQTDGSFRSQFYRAESLWEWYQRSADSARPPVDPLTRQPVWYEDWWALHERFDPQGTVPYWAHELAKFDAARAAAREAARQKTAIEDLNARAAAWLIGDGERREELDESSEQSNLQALREFEARRRAAPEPAPLSAQFARILAEEREEREEEVDEHRHAIQRGQERWGEMIQDDATPLASMLFINRRLTYHEQYVYVHLARLLAIADAPDEGARRQVDEWERAVLRRGATRQAYLQSKRGQEPDEVAARIEARANANAALDRIRLRERDTIYRRP